MKTAIALLFVALCGTASAQTSRQDALEQVIADLKACVRANASSARESGLHGEKALAFLREKCGPLTGDINTAQIGPLPPGIYRRAVDDEWRNFSACTVGCREICGSLNAHFAAVCVDASKTVKVTPMNGPSNAPACARVCVE